MDYSLLIFSMLLLQANGQSSSYECDLINNPSLRDQNCSSLCLECFGPEPDQCFRCNDSEDGIQLDIMELCGMTFDDPVFNCSEISPSEAGLPDFVIPLAAGLGGALLLVLIFCCSCCCCCYLVRRRKRKKAFKPQPIPNSSSSTQNFNFTTANMDLSADLESGNLTSFKLQTNMETQSDVVEKTLPTPIIMSNSSSISPLILGSLPPPKNPPPTLPPTLLPTLPPTLPPISPSLQEARVKNSHSSQNFNRVNSLENQKEHARSLDNLITMEADSPVVSPSHHFKPATLPKPHSLAPKNKVEGHSSSYNRSSPSSDVASDSKPVVSDSEPVVSDSKPVVSDSKPPEKDSEGESGDDQRESMLEDDYESPELFQLDLKQQKDVDNYYNKDVVIKTLLHRKESDDASQTLYANIDSIDNIDNDEDEEDDDDDDDDKNYEEVRSFRTDDDKEEVEGETEYYNVPDGAGAEDDSDMYVYMKSGQAVMLLEQAKKEEKKKKKSSDKRRRGQSETVEKKKYVNYTREQQVLLEAGILGDKEKRKNRKEENSDRTVQDQVAATVSEEDTSEDPQPLYVNRIEDEKEEEEEEEEELYTEVT